MKHTWGAYCGLGLLLLVVMGCNPQKSEGNGAPVGPILDPNTKSEDDRKPGTHCFNLKVGSEFTECTLTNTASGTVDGVLRGTVVDAEGHETIYNTSFKGTIAGDTLVLEVMSDRTGQRQNTNEKWTWKDGHLSTGQGVMNPSKCP